MDMQGIEVVSMKSLDTSQGQGHVNHGYIQQQDADGNSTATTKEEQQQQHNKPDPTTKTDVKPTDANGSSNGGSVRMATDNAQYMKKDSSTVDFTLPGNAKAKERDRSKSIGGDDHYRERSKSISDGPYRGMGKEELLRYSSRPLWRNLRYACMSIVLTGWLALLITVVALVLTYPSCREASRKDWWQKTVVYRIYVRSFLDTNEDGIGDLKGIQQKLQYLEDTGINTISLSPIYRLASNAETDTHIVNHTEIDSVFGTMEDFRSLVNETHSREIDSVFGTMEDFRSLVNETHSRGMHILLDFVPNHTSDEHPWFTASKTDANPRTNPYRSYYMWTSGQQGNSIPPPNNWQSVYDCPAWKYVTPPNSHFLHQFLDTQPDLNLRSEKVRVELEDILMFWLNMGVDGFYIRDSDFLFEDYDLRDDRLVDNSTEKEGCRDSSGKDYVYDGYQHEYTKGLTEVFDMLARWRAFLDEKGNETGSYKMLVADVDGSYKHVMNYYGLFNRDGLDFPLNKFSLGINMSSNGGDVSSMVTTWMSQMPFGRWANWMGGDDRSPRLADRLGEQMALPYLMLIMLLPGTPYLYYGDEIGMSQPRLNTSQPWSRNQSMRSPMQWNDMQSAGFCNSYCEQPWMALNPNHADSVNVEAQQENPYSSWHLLRNLSSLRTSSPSFEYGDYVPSIQDQEVFSFVREFDGEKGYLVALNFVNRTVKKPLTGTHSTIPGGATIEVISGVTSRQKGDSLDLDPVTLEPYQGVVVSWAYKAKEL